MRLLNTTTLELHSFMSLTAKARRMYAILSHTWEDEEILFDDVKNGPQAIPRHKKGFPKVEGSARYAKEQGLDWIWIDTCCIDKSSSAELSEAINSMFIWYKRARVCFAYLSDVKSPDELASSRWFSRGWTLQELIAPVEVEFLDSSWRLMGNRTDMASSLSRVTRVDELLLLGHHDIDAYSISTRMGWASRRETSREEDRAYSLLGIFEVNLPLLYGEGLNRAFFRLQEEIMKMSSDQSIFVFRQSMRSPVPDIRRLSMGYHVASGPAQFQLDDPVIDDDPYERSYAALHPITLHPHGVTFRAWIGPATFHLDKYTSARTQLVILNCCFQSDALARPAFLVTNFDGLLVRISTPLLRAVPVTLQVPGDGPVSAIEVVVDETERYEPWFKEFHKDLKGARVEAAHMAEFSEQLVTISQPYNKDSRPHLGLCRISTTSKHFVARHDHVVKPRGREYEWLLEVFGHLGSIAVTGPEGDRFHILWGYAKDDTGGDSSESNTHPASHIQYFGRRSVEAWEGQEPRCVLTHRERKPRPIPEKYLRNLGPERKWRLGVPEKDRTPGTLGDICSLDMYKPTGLSPSDLPSWAISRRDSGLVVRVDVRLRTFLSRTCVEVEISDCPPDTETNGTGIPPTVRPAAPEATDTFAEDSQHTTPKHTQAAREEPPSEIRGKQPDVL